MGKGKIIGLILLSVIASGLCPAVTLGKYVWDCRVGSFTVTVLPDPQISLLAEIPQWELELTDIEYESGESWIRLIPSEGYRMPETMVLVLDGVFYDVHTDGRRNPDGIVYDSRTGTLSLSSDLLGQIREELYLAADGVEMRIREDSEPEAGSGMEPEAKPETKPEDMKIPENGDETEKKTENGTESETEAENGSLASPSSAAAV